MIFYHGSSAEPFDRFSLAHALEGDGKVKFGWGIFGNFAPAPIVVDGIHFDCTEKLFQRIPPVFQIYCNNVLHT